MAATVVIVVGYLNAPREGFVLSVKLCHCPLAIHIVYDCAGTVSIADAFHRLSSVSDSINLVGDILAYIAHAVFDIPHCNCCQLLVHLSCVGNYQPSRSK